MATLHVDCTTCWCYWVKTWRQTDRGSWWFICHVRGWWLWGAKTSIYMHASKQSDFQTVKKLGVCWIICVLVLEISLPNRKRRTWCHRSLQICLNGAFISVVEFCVWFLDRLGQNFCPIYKLLQLNARHSVQSKTARSLPLYYCLNRSNIQQYSLLRKDYI
jgi:hypothetical protein